MKVHTEQSYISEELALAEVINGANCIAHSVVVFDRGLQSRNSFDKFTNTDKLFVTRANPNIRCKVIASKETGIKPAESTVTIISDNTGFLITRKEKKTLYPYRVIRGTMD